MGKITKQEAKVKMKLGFLTRVKRLIKRYKLVIIAAVAGVGTGVAATIVAYSCF